MADEYTPTTDEVRDLYDAKVQATLVRLFNRLERLEASAIQLGIDLGDVRSELALAAQDAGAKL